MFESRRPLSVLLVGLLSTGVLGAGGCTHETTGREPEARTPHDEGAREARASCTAPELANARSLLPYVELPRGCSFVGAGSEAAPRVVHDASELASAIACEAGVAGPSIDLTANDVYVVGYTMSPGSAGIEAFDDGTRVTFLSRFRSPCPGDPMPMPMNSAFAFVLPKGEARTFGTASCTIHPRCR